ncbi:DUF4214 domain-containing protein [Candidatus Arthromitus sp. SFB-turkey]|uniref:DUF4214 domain-containing protein n=1 Tax=Candidatus Arthromitus sp. SFB-turkey TaxID=1840217 RepID=UPI0007F48D2E|nr:DUF4214 domain-containing protein [Candidatus Arthromitus sp. SFB-turkey]OAT86841.1 alkaline phosphatase [Candidatus Arthromitus sp. SFB-turkey]
MKKNIKKIVLGSLLSLSLCLGGFSAYAETKEEYLDSFLDSVYSIMLNREADEEGKSYWSGKILSGDIGILDFLNQILSQEEFASLSISSEDFITKNYNLLINREPDEDGFNYWMSKLGENSTKEQQLNLINQMAHSEEFIGKINEMGIVFKIYEEEKPVVVPEQLSDIDIFIRDAYEHILGRQYDQEGFNYWKGQLTSQDKGAIDLINQFISLDEFKARNLTDQQFIGVMYEVLFNRTADQDGLNYWNSIYQKDKSSNRMANIVLNIADNTEFLSRIKNMNVIFKKVDLNLFYSELLTTKNNIRSITSNQLSEIKMGMTFFDIIVKLGRTKNVSSVNGVNIAKYTVDGSKEMYFIFSDPSSTYKFDPMEVLKAQK